MVFPFSRRSQTWLWISLLSCGVIFTSATISQARNNGSIHLMMGTPSSVTADPTNKDDFLIVKRQYALSYNNNKGIANWVSWQLNRSWLGGVDRCRGFSPDSTLPAGFRRVTDSDYRGSGFTRGHMTRAGDRTVNQTDNCATFLMTNIIPQTEDLNGGPWLQLEDLSKELAQQGKELYIIAGGTGEGGTGKNGFATRIGRNDVSVPATNWKIVVVLDRPGLGIKGVTAKTRVIAVNMPNKQGIKNTQWQAYRTTVDEIEKLTGYDFLSDVPTEIQDAIEAKQDGD
jgi:endonuclease G, mitochondrial